MSSGTCCTLKRPTGYRAPASSWSMVRTTPSTHSTGRPCSRNIGDTRSTSCSTPLRRRAQKNLVTLDGWHLTPEQLPLKGTHPALGTVTLSQLLATWVVHDLNHIGQIVEVMAHQYADAVGPWRAYLAILTRPILTE